MKTLSEFNKILEANELDSILDNTLMLSKYHDIRRAIKAFLKKNFTNINNVYLVFKNADEAQSWVDFSFFNEINGKKFSDLNGNFMIDNKIYNKSQTYLNDVTNIDLLKDNKSESNFPFLSISGFGKNIKIAYSNRMKTDKYNIVAYLTEI